MLTAMESGGDEMNMLLVFVAKLSNYQKSLEAEVGLALLTFKRHRKIEGDKSITVMGTFPPIAENASNLQLTDLQEKAVRELPSLSSASSAQFIPYEILDGRPKRALLDSYRLRR